MAQPPLPQIPLNPSSDPGKAIPLPLPQTQQGQLLPAFSGGSQTGGGLLQNQLGMAPAKPFQEVLQSLKLAPVMPTDKLALGMLATDLKATGLLSKVIESAGSAILQYVQSKKLFQGALQGQMMQDIQTLQKSLQPVTSMVPGMVAEMKIPAAATALPLANIPTAAMNSQIVQQMAPFIAQSAVGALQEYFAPNMTNVPSAPVQKAQNIVASLIAMKIDASQESEMQLVIPKEAMASNIPAQQLTLTKQSMMAAIEEAHQQYQAYSKIAQQHGLETSKINVLRFGAEQALALVRNIPYTESSLVIAYVGVWLANRKSVEATLMQYPLDQLAARRDSIKAVIQTLTDMTGRPLLGQDQKFAMLEQLLSAMPSLLNITIISQMLTDLENEAQEMARRLALQKNLLFYAAKEIVQIASRRPTAYYHAVGLLHEQLDVAANKLQLMLPKKALEVTDLLYKALFQEIRVALSAVLEENPGLFREVLRYHPRLFLFFVYVDSPLIEDVKFPTMPEALYTNEGLALFEEVTNRLAMMAAFQKYHPKVLLLMLSEAKGDLSQAVSKNALKVAFTAANETISSLVREQQEAFKVALKPLWS